MVTFWVTFVQFWALNISPSRHTVPIRMKTSKNKNETYLSIISFQDVICVRPQAEILTSIKMKKADSKKVSLINSERSIKMSASLYQNICLDKQKWKEANGYRAQRLFPKPEVQGSNLDYIVQKNSFSHLI